MEKQFLKPLQRQIPKPHLHGAAKTGYPQQMALVHLPVVADESRGAAPPPPLLGAFEAWCTHQRQSGRLRRASSEAVYRAMWQALAAWCVAQSPPRRLHDLGPANLQAYVAGRDGIAGPGQALTARYQWRLWRLVQRVQGHADDLALARRRPLLSITAAPAARQALTAGAPGAPPTLRHADAAEADGLPLHLAAAELAALRQHLDTAPGDPRWQAHRNRCAVALQLGAGLGPGDVRALRLGDVLTPGAPMMNLPMSDLPPSDGLAAKAPMAVPPAQPTQLRVPASGSAPAHPTPVDGWAAVLLAHWLQLRAQQRLAGDWLFPSTRGGKPWGKVAQYGAALQVLADAGVAAGAGGSFRLRHTFALQQLQAGQAPELVAQWLGVVDPAVMQRYQRVMFAGVAEVARGTDSAEGTVIADAAAPTA